MDTRVVTKPTLMNQSVESMLKPNLEKSMDELEDGEPITRNIYNRENATSNFGQ